MPDDDPDLPRQTPPAEDRWLPSSADDLHLHSVFDEPAIFPRNENQPIDSDWPCSRCGYNLRGLTTGLPCPECSHIELYAPPPQDAPSYGWWLRNRQRHTTVARSWLAVVGAAMLASPLAIAGAFFNAAAFGILLTVFIGPTIEETVKIAAAIVMVDTRPYLIKNRAQVWFMTLTSAALFAVIENVVFLEVYLKSPSGMTVAWRWVVCSLLHILCTGIATRGCLGAWHESSTRLRKPALNRHVAPVAVAIIAHGTYNLVASALGYPGLLF